MTEQAMSGSNYMAAVSRAISTGRAATLAELERQKELYARQRERRYSAPPKSRFAIASHMTKTETKIRRLENAIDERGWS